MKKILFCIAVVAVLIGAGIGIYLDVTSSEPDAVMRVIDSDKAIMTKDYSKSYAWFETDIILDSIYTCKDSAKIASIQNVFFYDDSIPCTVIMIHKENFDTVIVKNDWYLQCVDMNKSEIKYDFTTMLKKVDKSNNIKPQTKYITLRNPLGPNPTNPYWIWGNGKLWVNAITGKISTQE